MIPLGAMIGSFTAGPLMSIGRKNAMIVIDLIILIGALLNIVLDFRALTSGRLLIGWGAGASSVL